jgi:hypothetical protein
MTKRPRPGGANVEDYIRWALKLTDRVVCEYLSRSLRPDEKLRSAEDLHAIINGHHEKYLGCQISVHELDPDEEYKNDSLFLGLIARRKRGVAPRIYLNPLLNKNGKRLALVQESYQALFDYRPLRSTRLHIAIGHYIVFQHRREFEIADGPTVGEIIAEIAAMETLFPYIERIKCVRDLGSNNADDEPLIAIANSFGVPLWWTRFYLKAHIMEQLKQFR